MAPISTSTVENSDTIFWISLGLGLSLLVCLIIMITMANQLYHASCERNEHKKREATLSRLQEAHHNSETERAVLARERVLLYRQIDEKDEELEKRQQALTNYQDELNKVHTFCQENYGIRGAFNSERSAASSVCSAHSDFSFEAEGPEGSGPESRAGHLRTPLTLTQLANGEAADRVVDGQYQVPRQVHLEDLPPINTGDDYWYLELDENSAPED
ncbi:hypothetical protein ACLX1H_002352 [Fusarium chlamydosporum]